MSEARDTIRACRVAIATRMYDERLPLSPQEFDLVASKFTELMIERGVTLKGNVLCLPAKK
jgi:hypothetical protein